MKQTKLSEQIIQEISRKGKLMDFVTQKKKKGNFLCGKFSFFLVSR